MKKALITGITGQDGAYLAELLIGKGYEVHGIKRRSSSLNTQRIDHLYQEVHQEEKQLVLHYGDITDTASIINIMQQVQPDEVYNLAAQSHVKVSFETPEYTAQADALGALRILEAIRLLGLTQKTKFYQASTSELFGNAPAPQNEDTPFQPCSPYATAKLYAHWITANYRDAYGIFACSGILFNHESPLRGETFVSRKITRAAARIAYGLQEKLYLGNLEAYRDWGYARDYVEAMWRMLQQPKPTDLVIATGKSYQVKDFVVQAFKMCDMHIVWEGSGINQVGRDTQTGKIIIEVDPRYTRPNEVTHLEGDASKAALLLNWQPTVDFHTLVRLMIEHDVALVEKEIGGRIRNNFESKQTYRGWLFNQNTSSEEYHEL